MTLDVYLYRKAMSVAAYSPSDFAVKRRSRRYQRRRSRVEADSMPSLDKS